MRKEFEVASATVNANTAEQYVMWHASTEHIASALGAGPRDGLMTGLQAASGLPIASIRIALEVTVVAAGWYLGGVVGAGTLLFAFGVGPCVALGILFVRKFL